MVKADLSGFIEKWKETKDIWSRTETYATMVFSTGHITQADLRKFELCARGGGKPPTPIIVDSYAYGVRVYCFAQSEHDWQDLQERCLQIDISPSAMECITWGRKAGCRWIEIDRDGPVYEGIATHDWAAEAAAALEDEERTGPA